MELINEMKVHLWSFSRILITIVRMETWGLRWVVRVAERLRRSACRFLVLSAEIVYEMGDDG